MFQILTFRRITMKKIISLTIALLTLSVFCLSPFAERAMPSSGSNALHTYGVDIAGSGEPGSIGFSRALAECGGGPHDMLAHGWGDIYDVDKGKTIVSNGACAQCTKCNLVIVTQGEPGTGSALGYYATWQPGEQLSSFVTCIRTNTAFIVHTSSSSIPGMRFRYA